MTLGDRIKVTVDAGGRTADEETVTAGSAGGSVDWELKGSFVEVTEYSRRKRPLRRLAFSAERVISVVEEPRRQ